MTSALSPLGGSFPVPTQPVPLERLLLPTELSGLRGANRAPGNGRLAANDDLAAVTAWLANYAGSEATLAAYRKEVERLLLWAVLQQHKPISSLTHEDFLAYERFLQNPLPAERWVLVGSKKKLGRSDPGWRPFAGPLSASSVRHALVILNGCFAWLTEAGYLAGNPLSLSRRRRKKSTQVRVTRYLSHEMWDEVKSTVEAMRQESPREALHAARCRWVFSVLYLAGLRVSEVTGTTMGAFTSRRDGKGNVRWWLEVTGKGEKVRTVPATVELMAELARYRMALGMEPTPLANETSPLVLPIIGRERPLTRGALYLVIKEMFRRTAARLRQQGPEGASLATVIAHASAHWLRHTAGTHMADQEVDVRYVRDTFGHSSLATTSGYLHTEEDARHQAIQDKHRLGWADASVSSPGLTIPSKDTSSEEQYDDHTTSRPDFRGI